MTTVDLLPTLGVKVTQAFLLLSSILLMIRKGQSTLALFNFDGRGKCLSSVVVYHAAAAAHFKNLRNQNILKLLRQIFGWL